MIEINEYIESSENESFISVIESYLSILDKYDSLSEYPDSIIQENYFRQKDENGDPEKLIKTIIMAIPRLLMMIGNAIANVFRRLKGDPIKRLKDLEKKNDSELEEMQQKYDDNADGCADDVNNLTQKHLETTEKDVDSDLVENKNSNEQDEGYKKPDDANETNPNRRNLIEFNKKLMYSRIRFKGWKYFLEITEDYLDHVEYEVTQKRPTTKLLATTRHRLGIKGPKLLSERLNPFSRNTAFFHATTLFYWIPRVSRIGRYTEDAEEIMEKLKGLKEKAKEVNKRFKTLNQYYNENTNERPKALKRMQKVCDEIMNLYKIINILTNYLRDELMMWGQYLDIIEAAEEKKQKEKDKKKKKERKERKENEKNSPTIRVVHKYKGKDEYDEDDEDEDEDDDEDDEDEDENINEYVSNIYSRF